MTISIGVIGTGTMGRNHVRALAELNDRCRLVGVYDTNHEKAACIAREFETHAFSSLDQLVQSVDAAIVSVPVSSHYEVARYCLENGVHVLIEKPMTSTIDEGEALKSIAREKGLIIQVGHIELFNPTIRVLKDILRQEEVIAFDIHRLSPFSERVTDVDVVMDTMIHDLYILSYLGGSDPISCTAYGRTLLGNLNHVVALFQYADGLIATVTGSLVTEDKVRTVQVVTKNAYIQADLLDKKILVSRSTNFYLSERAICYKQQSITEKVMVPSREPLKDQLLHFIDCIRSDQTPLVTADEGLQTLRMAEIVKGNLVNPREAVVIR